MLVKDCQVGQVIEFTDSAGAKHLGTVAKIKGRVILRPTTRAGLRLIKRSFEITDEEGVITGVNGESLY